MRYRWLISLLATLLAAAPAMAEVVVIVRREAQPAGNYVRICDIARVDGPKDQAREVAMTVLGPTPAGGQTHEITRWDIEHRLYEMGLIAKVSFSGNEVVRVLGQGVARRSYPSADSYQPLNDMPQQSSIGGLSFGDGASALAKPEPRVFAARPDGTDGMDPFAQMTGDAKTRVGQVIANYLADRYHSANSARSDIEVEARVIGATANIPYAAHDVRVEEAVDGRVPGRAKLRLMVKDQADSTEREVTVSADTDVFARALVATRNLPRGESMNRGDVKVERVRMESGKNYLPPRPRAVEGREAQRAIKPGEAILDSDATLAEAVKRGQLVIVDTVGRGWRLQAKAKAHGSGTVGDIITVEDTETRKKYPVRITGRGTVSVVVNKDEIIFVRK